MHQTSTVHTFKPKAPSSPSSPSSPSLSRFKSAASNNPDTFSSTFDLLDELSRNREQYTCDEIQLTAYRFPVSLLMVIDQTRDQIPISITNKSEDYNLSRPGRNPTINCCLQHGVNLIRAHEDIKSIIRLRGRFIAIIRPENYQQRDADLAQAIFDAFEKFPLTVHDSSMSETRKQGLHLGKKLKDSIFGVRSELGVSLDAIVILCIQLSLSDAEWILPECRDRMRKSTEEFFRKVRVRIRMFEALLVELEK